MTDQKSYSVLFADRPCHVFEHGVGGPIILWGISEREADAFDALVNRLPSDRPYTLFTYTSTDWNSDFSPWAMTGADGRTFSGGGRATLDWLEGAALPYIKEAFPTASARLLVGYSLAGLFSLWAFYESQRFDGVACCSGSLWFDGWDEYADRHRAPEGSTVYLSLGGKEPCTRDPHMASIGEQYRKQAKRCKSDPNIHRFTHEMNRGGHFADPTGRAAKAIAWLIGQEKPSCP